MITFAFLFNGTVGTPTIFFSQPWDKFLWGDDSNFLLLRGDAVKQVGQTGEEGLLTSRLHLKKEKKMHQTHLKLTYFQFHLHYKWFCYDDIVTQWLRLTNSLLQDMETTTKRAPLQLKTNLGASLP